VFGGDRGASFWRGTLPTTGPWAMEKHTHTKQIFFFFFFAFEVILSDTMS